MCQKMRAWHFIRAKFTGGEKIIWIKFDQHLFHCQSIGVWKNHWQRFKRVAIKSHPVEFQTLKNLIWAKPNLTRAFQPTSVIPSANWYFGLTVTGRQQNVFWSSLQLRPRNRRFHSSHGRKTYENSSQPYQHEQNQQVQAARYPSFSYHQILAEMLLNEQVCLP